MQNEERSLERHNNVIYHSLTKFVRIALCVRQVDRCAQLFASVL